MSKNIWAFGEGYHKVYTESIDAVQAIVEKCDTNLCTTYHKDGNTFGWDIVVADKHLSKVKKILRGHIADKSSIS
jgi:hypothetical protein|tara:strand:+ start:76 stop:300 length:225 start_codon:yes stop_codon:yes gene_type:complete